MFVMVQQKLAKKKAGLISSQDCLCVSISCNVQIHSKPCSKL
jgi:hypothetical protein